MHTFLDCFRLCVFFYVFRCENLWGIPSKINHIVMFVFGLCVCVCVCLCFIWCSCKPFGLIYSETHKVHPPSNEWNTDNWRWLRMRVARARVFTCQWCHSMHVNIFVSTMYCLYHCIQGPGMPWLYCIWMMVSVDAQCVRITFCIESELENYRQSTKAGCPKTCKTLSMELATQVKWLCTHTHTHTILSVALKLWCRLNKWHIRWNCPKFEIHQTFTHIALLKVLFVSHARSRDVRLFILLDSCFAPAHTFYRHSHNRHKQKSNAANNNSNKHNNRDNNVNNQNGDDAAGFEVTTFSSRKL